MCKRYFTAFLTANHMNWHICTGCILRGVCSSPWETFGWRYPTFIVSLGYLLWSLYLLLLERLLHWRHSILLVSLRYLLWSLFERPLRWRYLILVESPGYLLWSLYLLILGRLLRWFAFPFQWASACCLFSYGSSFFGESSPSCFWIESRSVVQGGLVTCQNFIEIFASMFV